MTPENGCALFTTKKEIKENNYGIQLYSPLFAGQALLSIHSMESDLTKILVPMAFTLGVVLLALMLFIYYICRMVRHFTSLLHKMPFG